MSDEKLKEAINHAQAEWYLLFTKTGCEHMKAFIAGAINQGLMAREDITPTLARE